MTGLIGYFQGTRVLLLREKGFLYCLANTKDLRLSIMWAYDPLLASIIIEEMLFWKIFLQFVSWILAEFYFNRGLQRLYTGTCIILQKTINGFLCLFIVFLKSETYQLILKDVIKLNRNLR